MNPKPKMSSKIPIIQNNRFRQRQEEWKRVDDRAGRDRLIEILHG